MIITISLVNMNHLIQTENKRARKKYSFLVMRTLRISSLNNFHI